MKNAYVSVVLRISEDIQGSEIISLGEALQTRFQKFEMVLFGKTNGLDLSNFEGLNFPVSIISSYSGIPTGHSMISAYGRAVGDYILYWDYRNPFIPLEILDTFVKESNGGSEYVAVKFKQRALSKIVNVFLNRIGVSAYPYSRLYGGFFSRRLLGQILVSDGGGDGVELVLARTNLQRSHVDHPSLKAPDEPFLERVKRIRFFLTRGSKLGTLLPSFLASLSSLFALAAAIYSLTIFILDGKTPEGWTTLMMLVGFGQASILFMQALIWSQITEIQSSKLPDDNSDNITVYGVKSSQHIKEPSE